MHLPSFQKLEPYIIRSEKIKNLVRISALLKNISILPITLRAKQDQFYTNFKGIFHEEKNSLMLIKSKLFNV